MTPASAPQSQDLDRHVQDVNDCPRCGSRHEHVHFRRLQRPAHLDGGVFEFWASCPATGEPLLLEVPEVMPP